MSKNFRVALISICFMIFSCQSSKTNFELNIDLISAKDSQASGSIKLSQKAGLLIISGEIKDLTPGFHGFHIHDVGDCRDISNGFKTAGGHYNPHKSKHGSIHDGHRGDLGNIIANENGIAKIYLEIEKINIIKNNSQSVLDRSIIIHASADDEATDPAGNSGPRILCGVIK